MLEMKVFNVLLSGIGLTHVEADRYEEGEVVKFFRGEFAVAEFPKVSVKEITVSTLPPLSGGVLFSAE